MNHDTISDINAAIGRSISHTEIVRVTVPDEKEALAYLDECGRITELDHARENDGSLDVWGARQGSDFRLRIITEAPTPQPEHISAINHSGEIIPAHENADGSVSIGAGVTPQPEREQQETAALTLTVPEYEEGAEESYPGNIAPGNYDHAQIVALLRTHANNPGAVQFIADMMEQ